MSSTHGQDGAGRGAGQGRGMHLRNYPSAMALKDKCQFAEILIREEHHYFGDSETALVEDNFEKSTREYDNRIRFASSILCGMLVRGRLEAAVLNVFLQFCAQGRCSL